MSIKRVSSLYLPSIEELKNANPGSLIYFDSNNRMKVSSNVSVLAGNAATFQLTASDAIYITGSAAAGQSSPTVNFLTTNTSKLFISGAFDTKNSNSSDSSYTTDTISSNHDLIGIDTAEVSGSWINKSASERILQLDENSPANMIFNVKTNSQGEEYYEISDVSSLNDDQVEASSDFSVILVDDNYTNLNGGREVYIHPKTNLVIFDTVQALSNTHSTNSGIIYWAQSTESANYYTNNTSAGYSAPSTNQDFLNFDGCKVKFVFKRLPLTSNEEFSTSTTGPTNDKYTLSPYSNDIGTNPSASGTGYPEYLDGGTITIESYDSNNNLISVVFTLTSTLSLTQPYEWTSNTTCNIYTPTANEMGWQDASGAIFGVQALQNARIIYYLKEAVASQGSPNGVFINPLFNNVNVTSQNLNITQASNYEGYFLYINFSFFQGTQNILESLTLEHLNYRTRTDNSLPRPNILWNQPSGLAANVTSYAFQSHITPPPTPTPNTFKHDYMKATLTSDLSAAADIDNTFRMYFMGNTNKDIYPPLLVGHLGIGLPTVSRENDRKYWLSNKKFDSTSTAPYHYSNSKSNFLIFPKLRTSMDWDSLKNNNLYWESDPTSIANTDPGNGGTYNRDPSLGYAPNVVKNYDQNKIGYILSSKIGQSSRWFGRNFYPRITNINMGLDHNNFRYGLLNLLDTNSTGYPVKFPIGVTQYQFIRLRFISYGGPTSSVISHGSSAFHFLRQGNSFSFQFACSGYESYKFIII